MTLHPLAEDIGLAEQLESWIKSTEGFELCMPRTLALCVFRLAPSDVPQEQLNALNKKLADRLNKRNDLFFTPTSIPDDIYVSASVSWKPLPETGDRSS